jgi:hypothetical protein
MSDQISTISIARRIRNEIRGIMEDHEFQPNTSDNHTLFQEHTVKYLESILSEDYKSSVLLSEDKIYLPVDYIFTLEFLPFILNIKPEKVYTLYRGDEECGKVYYNKILEVDKVGWSAHYTPNVSVERITIEFAIDDYIESRK